MSRSRLSTGIPFSSIRYNSTGPRLGHGSYGVVYAGERPAREGTRHHYEKIDVAVKLWHKTHLSTIEEQKQFMREIEIAMYLHHPALLPLLCFSVSPVATVAPLMTGDLRKAMRGGSGLIWNDTKRSIAAIGVAAGMAFLHANGVIHRDFKPENVMVDSRSWPKIADFGFARFLPSDPALKMTCSLGSLLYMAPELITGEDYGPPVDVYAYAMLLFELCTQQRPFAGVSEWELTHRVVGLQRPAIPAPVSQQFAELITKCWAHEQADRPAFADIVQWMLAKQEDGQYPYVFEGTDIAEYEEYLAYLNTPV
jgi:serine/threonine protein kinase